jgi:hypothetical protein
MSEITNFAKEYALRFAYIDKRSYACLDEEREEVVINLPLFLAACLVHEFFHYKHPDFKERKIVGKENRKLKRMSKREIQELAATVFINALAKEK